MRKTLPLWQVDAFTDHPFGGNPAAVCLVDRPYDDGWAQSVAAEMNLSETAFVTRSDQTYGLRWFTPTTEVSLCGHATLATAHALWEDGADTDELRFATASGPLTARRAEGLIWLDFPTLPATATGSAEREELAAAIGVTPRWVGRSEHDHLVEVRGAAEILALRPDLDRLRALGTGVIVTARARDGRHDFLSRYFDPAEGIDEDPVTGSAHCVLGPYWAQRLGRDELFGHQASTRGGEVRVRVAGDRTHLGGTAVTVLRGNLTAAG